jgi:hypothetical protein
VKRESHTIEFIVIPGGRLKSRYQRATEVALSVVSCQLSVVSKTSPPIAMGGSRLTPIPAPFEMPFWHTPKLSHPGAASLENLSLWHRQSFHP